MISLTDYKDLLGKKVIISFIERENTPHITGLWSDCLFAEDAEDDNVQEDALVIDMENGNTVCVFVSEIKDIKKV